MYQKNDQQLTFHKSSYSATQNDCVEVAETPTGAAVRDTKNRDRGHLMFTTEGWTAFLGTVSR